MNVYARNTRRLSGLVAVLFAGAIQVPFILHGSMFNAFAAGVCAGVAISILTDWILE